MGWFLFKKVLINSQSDFIANHIISLYELNTSARWIGSAINLEGFLFTSNNPSGFSLQEKSALNYLRYFIIGEFEEDERDDLNEKEVIVELLYNETTKVYFLKTTIINQQLSTLINELIFEELKEQYTKNIAEENKRIISALNESLDSLSIEITKDQQNLKIQSQGLEERTNAVFTELKNNRLPVEPEGLLSREALVQIDILSERLKLLNETYVKVRDKLEEVKFFIKNREILFPVLQQSFIPEEEKTSLVLSSFLGLLLGFVFGTGFLIGKKFFIDKVV